MKFEMFVSFILIGFAVFVIYLGHYFVVSDGGKEEKLVTATKKGGAVLDQWLPDHIKANYHVMQQVILTR